MNAHSNKIFSATVLGCELESPRSLVSILRLHIKSDDFHPTAGQFVVLEPLERTSVAPRPFTIVSFVDHTLTLLINSVGTNTRKYALLKPGDHIHVYGPYGKEIHLDENCTSCVLVGGGIGNATLPFLARNAVSQKKCVTVLLGAKDEGLIPALTQFDALPFKPSTITEHGSVCTGFVTQLLHETLHTDKGHSTVVACGPKKMLRKVFELCAQHGNPCIVIVEEIMVCGMGSCKGCAIFGGDEGKEVRHVCSDGPAFDAYWIDWEKFCPQTFIQVTEPRFPVSQEAIGTQCDICGITLSTPLLNCSGTLDIDACEDGSVDITGLGAFVIKGLSLGPRPGNPTPRVCETPSGMLNAIGLEYIGVEVFIKDILPRLRKLNIPIIANINGISIEEYCALTEQLNDTDVTALEVNISCPNVKQGGIAFGVDPAVAARVTTAVKEKSRMPVIVKLTPNVTDIASIARAIEDAGADAISLINTVLGGAIDVWHRRPRIANVFAGLSGPAIRPIAIRCVMQVANAVNIPIIGMGGNENGYTAAEFMMAGATATAFGTSGFANRTIFPQAIEQLREVAYFHGFSSTNALVKSIRSQS